MREIRTYGSEGGGTLTRPPYPYWLDTRSLAVGALISVSALAGPAFGGL